VAPYVDRWDRPEPVRATRRHPTSKLARRLALAALLAAVHLAGLTAVAQARPPTGQGGGGATVRRMLTDERSSMPNGAPAPVVSPVRPTEPSRQARWLAPALGVLAAVLALVAVVARRASRLRRAGQTA
jgi:hypothetical protein